MPLFYKILVANSLIVALGAVAGTVITVWHVQRFPNDIHYGLIGLFALAGWGVSFVVNRWVLGRTLQPLDCLQAGVDAVARGQLDVTLDCPGPTDDRFDRLLATFNQMVRRQAEDAQRLHQLSQRILQAQEEERQRVARELHDEAAQALTSLLVQLRLLERSQTPEAAQASVRTLRELTALALEEVRRISLDLRPKILDDLGLVSALGWRVDEFNAAGGALASLQTTGISGRLPHDLELAFYRVAQEALNNVARHAQAENVHVQLAWSDGHLCLIVQDDGIGFSSHDHLQGEPAGLCLHDPKEQFHISTAGDQSRTRPWDTSGGLGLLGIQERMSMIGGTIEISSKPGRGTVLSACAPVVTPDGGAPMDDPIKKVVPA